MRRLTVLLVLLLAGPGWAEDGYRFVLDGEEIAPSRIAVEGTSETPAPGDVVCVGGIWVTLEEPGEYGFRMESNKLWRESEGKSVLYGLSLHHGARRPKLTDEECASLRGVFVRAGSRVAAPLLPRLDATRVCLRIQLAGADAGEVEIPAGLERLFLEGNRREPTVLGSIRTLRKQTGLRLFVARGASILLDNLRRSAKLRHLAAPHSRNEHLGVLEGMTELRWLDLREAEGLPNVEFARRTPALRHLDLRGTDIADLAPLSAHPGLEELRLSGAPVRSLPEGRLPRLRRVTALGTDAPHADWLAFEARNPGCRMVWSRLVQLRRAVESCDRLRVRSGGTCHRKPEKERTLVEVNDSEKVAAFLELIEIDEASSGGECMCCGNPTFEFREGEAVLAEVGFHHGVRLRWWGWDGDSALTIDSALAVCDWLAERGVTEPRDEVRESLLSQRAKRLRWEAIRAILPPAAYDALVEAYETGEYRPAVDSAAATPLLRARIALRILGCHEGDWNWRDPVDGACVDLLDATEPAIFREALTGIADDPAARNGAARWLFEEGAHERLPTDLVRGILPLAGLHGAAHPGEHSRRRTLCDLGQIRGDAAIAILREVLSGALRPRDLGPDGTTRFQGMIRQHREDGDVEAVSDRTIAAVLLARLRDRESLPAIRSFLDEAPKEDRPLLEESIRTLR